MLDYSFINREDLSTLDSKIELAERRVAIQKMSATQLQEELQIAQKELANLHQKHVKMKEALEEKEMNEFRKSQQEADRKAALGIVTALAVMTAIVEEIGNELAKSLKKSPTKSKPDKIILSPGEQNKTVELTR